MRVACNVASRAIESHALFPERGGREGNDFSRALFRFSWSLFSLFSFPRDCGIDDGLVVASPGYSSNERELLRARRGANWRIFARAQVGRLRSADACVALRLRRFARNTARRRRKKERKKDGTSDNIRALVKAFHDIVEHKRTPEDHRGRINLVKRSGTRPSRQAAKT